MTTTIDRAQDYVVAPEEITMTTLLTPPAGDARTAEEYTFDMMKSGQCYAVAATPAEDARLSIAREADGLLGELKGWIDEHTTEEADDEELAADYYGVLISPGAKRAGDNSLCHIPILAIHDNIPTIQLGGRSEPPQRVYEIVRLDRRGLVVLDAEHDVFVMTAAEFAEQTGDDNAEGNERAARIAALPIEDRLFAALISDQFDRVPETHRTMAQAGMILLAAAVDSVGPEDGDGDEQEMNAAHIHRTAYEQGFEAGFEKCIKVAKEILAQRKNAA
jgi:hypothetical protein